MEPLLWDSIMSYSPVVELGKIDSVTEGKDLPLPPDGQPSCLPNFHGMTKPGQALKLSSFCRGTVTQALPEDTEKVKLMEATQPTHKGRQEDLQLDKLPSSSFQIHQLLQSQPYQST